MLKSFFQIYKIQFLIAVTLSIALIAIRAERLPVIITLIILGCLLGMFLLDLDYIIHAYFIAPEEEFSKTVRAYIKHLDFINALEFIRFHRDDVKDKTLNSALFQSVLAAVSIFVMSSPTNVFIKAAVLSMLVNSLYRMAEYYFENKTEAWFWNINMKLHKRSLILYVGVIFAIVVASASIF